MRQSAVWTSLTVHSARGRPALHRSNGIRITMPGGRLERESQRHDIKLRTASGAGEPGAAAVREEGAVKLWGQKSSVCVSEASPLTGANGETPGSPGCRGSSRPAVPQPSLGCGHSLVCAGGTGELGPDLPHSLSESAKPRGLTRSSPRSIFSFPLWPFP